jgi:hypothetical protein
MTNPVTILSVYEVEWRTESGGNPRLISDEVVASSEGEAMEVAYSDYYFVGSITCRVLYEATEDQIISYNEGN